MGKKRGTPGGQVVRSRQGVVSLLRPAAARRRRYEAILPDFHALSIPVAPRIDVQPHDHLGSSIMLLGDPP
jgi:hypothetical protein